MAGASGVVAEDAGETGVGIPREARGSNGDGDTVFRIYFCCFIGRLGIICGAIPCAKNRMPSIFVRMQREIAKSCRYSESVPVLIVIN